MPPLKGPLVLLCWTLNPITLSTSPSSFLNGTSTVSSRSGISNAFAIFCLSPRFLTASSYAADVGLELDDITSPIGWFYKIQLVIVKKKNN